MNPFEKLSEHELDLMYDYIDEYLSEEKYYEVQASIKTILRPWSSAKEKLFHAFGDQLILSKEITFLKEPDQIEEEVENRLTSSKSEGYSIFLRNYLSMIGKNFSIEDTDEVIYNLRDLASCECLANNFYDGENFEIPSPKSDKKIRISYGCKPLRAIQKIAEAYDLSGFERFRIIHSQILNQKKLKGNLCLSIHPLDYMTMSDNDCGWESCMSWRNFGSYRQGTVEMMNSPIVVVAYLTAEDNMLIPGGQWNNKKWRELFIVDNKIITNIKGYPYENDSLVSEVLNWLKEIAEKANIGHYNDELCCYDAFTTFGFNEKDISFYFETGYMYNDFGNKHWGFISKNIEEGCHYINYSGCSECLACGQTDIDVVDESLLIGECCTGAYSCDHCGATYQSDECFTEVDDEWICPDCVENYCDTDSFFGELHFDSNLNRIYVSFDDGKSIYPTDLKVCAWDLEDSDSPELGRFFSNIYSSYKFRTWRRTYWVKAEEVNWKKLFEVILTNCDNLEEFKEDIISNNTSIKALDSRIDDDALFCYQGDINYTFSKSNN